MYMSNRNVKENLESGKEAMHGAADTARETVIEIKDDLNDVVHRAGAVANKAGRKVRNLVDTASHEVAHAGKSVSAHIKDKPVQSSLMALGAGIVLGVLLRRK